MIGRIALFTLVTIIPSVVVMFCVALSVALSVPIVPADHPAARQSKGARNHQNDCNGFI